MTRRRLFIGGGNAPRLVAALGRWGGAGTSPGGRGGTYLATDLVNTEDEVVHLVGFPPGDYRTPGADLTVYNAGWGRASAEGTLLGKSFDNNATRKATRGIANLFPDGKPIAEVSQIFP